MARWVFAIRDDLPFPASISFIQRTADKLARSISMNDYRRSNVLFTLNDPSHP